MKFAFCPYCGYKLDNDFAFCPKCGKKLSIDGETETVKTTETTVNTPEQTDDLFGGALGGSNANPSDFDFSSLKNMLDGEIDKKNASDKKHRLIRVLCIRGKYDEATELCNELIESDPEDLAAYIGLVRVESKNYTILEGETIDDAIDVARQIGGRDSDLSDYDDDLAAYFKNREKLFAEKLKAEEERKATEAAALKAEEERKKKRAAEQKEAEERRVIEEIKRKAKENAERKEREEAWRIENAKRQKEILERRAREEEERKKQLAEEKFLEDFEVVGSAIVKCLNPDYVDSVVIPDGITTIDKGAFANSKVTSVTLPDTVTSIEKKAFFGCRSLTKINIPESVISIKDSAFGNCVGLTSISLPDSLDSIAWKQFDFCSHLTSINMGNGIKTINSFAFSNCSNLTSVVIPSGVTFIDSFAFLICDNLSNVELPDTLNSIGNAFSSCPSLRQIKFKGSSDEWMQIKGYKHVKCEILCEKDGVILNKKK